MRTKSPCACSCERHDACRRYARGGCCDPGRPAVDFAGAAGTQGTLSGVEGVQATIEEYHPFVSSGSESLMWVMLNDGGTK